MGQCVSVCAPSSRIEISDESPTLLWAEDLTRRNIREEYEADGTVPVGCDEKLLMLRLFLSNQQSLGDFGKYARRINCMDLLVCWTDILEFKGISPETDYYQNNMARHILDKYINDPHILKLNGLSVDPALYSLASEAISKSESCVLLPTCNGSDIRPVPLSNMFDTFHQQCLQAIYDQLFVSFMKTRMGGKSVKHLGLSRTVTTDDFRYYRTLGVGAFGVVVHVVKKTTGAHYAMKIQRKHGLMTLFADSPGRVVFEKEALVRCQHPFIVGLAYAFQTPALAFLVMDLATAGTLQQLIDAAGQCDVSTVQFYAAEISLGLNHIHQLGLIYRDLKPSNVLLQENGHIQLADMGGIVDTGSRSLGVMRSMSSNSAEGCSNASFLSTLGGNSYVSRVPLSLTCAPSDSGVDQITDMRTVGNSRLKVQPTISEVDSKSVSLASVSEHRSEDVVGVNPSVHGRSSDQSGHSARVHTGNASFGNKQQVVADNSINSDKSVMAWSEKHMALLYMSKLGSIDSSPDGGASHVHGSNSGEVKSFDPAQISINSHMGRAKSFMGTAGYMAPEVLAMRFGSNSKGYTKAVDFWSLGAMIYALLHGTVPFPQLHLNNYVEAIVKSNDKNLVAVFKVEFKKYFLDILEKSKCPSSSHDILMQLLEVEEENRLGFGRRGMHNFRQHPFFASINWSQVELKLCNHRQLCKEDLPFPDTAFESFELMLKHNNCADWITSTNDLSSANSDKTAEPFSTWDYISPNVIFNELGIHIDHNGSSSPPALSTQSPKNTIETISSKLW